MLRKKRTYTTAPIDWNCCFGMGLARIAESASLSWIQFSQWRDFLVLVKLAFYPPFKALKPAFHNIIIL